MIQPQEQPQEQQPQPVVSPWRVQNVFPQQLINSTQLTMDVNNLKINPQKQQLLESILPQGCTVIFNKITANHPRCMKAKSLSFRDVPNKGRLCIVEDWDQTTPERRVIRSFYLQQVHTFIVA